MITEGYCFSSFRGKCFCGSDRADPELASASTHMQKRCRITLTESSICIFSLFMGFVFALFVMQILLISGFPNTYLLYFCTLNVMNVFLVFSAGFSYYVRSSSGHGQSDQFLICK